MNMIWHHHERMQDIPPLHIRHIAQNIHHHVRNRPIAKMKRTSTPAIQQTIQSSKRPPGAYIGIMKHAARRQTAIETPGDKDRLIAAIQMRKPSMMKRHATIVN